jgi:ribonuclease HIII
MKVLLTIIVFLLGIMIYINLSAIKKHKVEDSKSIYDSKLDSIDNSLKSIFSLNERILRNDSNLKTSVTNITNNYKNVYEKTNDTAFNDFIPIIKNLLKRHNEVKLERSY